LNICLYTAAVALLAFAPAAAEAACELHIWPASGLHSISSGWFKGVMLGGIGKQREGYPSLSNDPLAPAIQITLLSAQPTAAMLGQNGAVLVAHDTPLTRRQVTVPGRHSTSTAPCYSELIVDDIFHEDAALSRPSLRVLFRFASYVVAPEPLRRHTGWTAKSVTAPLPKTDAEAQDLVAELRDAFVADFTAFATNVLVKARP
jgi:hypothetical protein